MWGSASGVRFFWRDADACLWRCAVGCGHARVYAYAVIPVAALLKFQVPKRETSKLGTSMCSSYVYEKL